LKKLDAAVTKEQLNAALSDYATKKDMEAVNESVGALLRKVDQISSTQPDGRTLPRILGNMQANPDFQREMGDAVHNALRTSGTVVVRNQTAAPQQVTVNGVSYWVQPGLPLQLTVPAGTLVAHLTHFEPPKNWTIAPPSYTQVIGIR
jgi:hypothetical protein